MGAFAEGNIAPLREGRREGRRGGGREGRREGREGEREGGGLREGARGWWGGREQWRERGR